jgi:hypothetical protein
MSLYGHTTCKVSCHVSTIWMIQSSKFCMFGKMNKSQYLSHMVSVWARSSCVGFVSMRPMHMYVLNRLCELWVLGLPGPILVLRSNSRSERKNVTLGGMKSSRRDRVWWWYYHSLTHGCFEENATFTMKEVTWMLHMWLWEAKLHSSYTNDFLLLSKHPLKGWRHFELGFLFV